jgi:hypothetical protein
VNVLGAIGERYDGNFSLAVFAIRLIAISFWSYCNHSANKLRRKAVLAARVLQFGWDDCYRGQVLQRAGYLVTKAETLESLRCNLEMAGNVDAVFVSEDSPQTTEQAAEVVRRHSKAPVILFRRLSVNIDESKFDQVYQGFVAPPVWLARTAELIAQSIDLHERSACLRLEAEAVRQETQRQCERSRMELARNKPPVL